MGLLGYMIFILIGILIHIILFASIFDIYFKAPILKGITPIESPSNAPAKRLVYFVEDGLKADTFYQMNNKASLSPYLRKIVTSTGAWGVSHTIMPSETRPGHVAMFSGFFEDFSSITSGWNDNPVEFDSVFNQSRYSWTWGSPDLLSMFRKGITNNHMYTDCYAANLIQFEKNDTLNLDTWVLERFKGFFKNASTDRNLEMMLNRDKLIFFIHFGKTDLIGHSYGPNVEKYSNNVRYVDEAIREIVSIIEEYFGHDNKTAYLFTSDHGMTDWGSHGAASVEETMTPFVAWGSGIRGPQPLDLESYIDGWEESWKLAHIKRVDIQQIDIAPLISILLGIPIPVNSVGVLPLKYLNTEWSHISDALITNTNQILSQYHHARDIVKDNRFSLFYSPYRDLSSKKKKEYFDMLTALQAQMRFKDAVQVSQKLIRLGLKGLDYFQKYDQRCLKVSITLSFLGWMGYVVSQLVLIHLKLYHGSLEENVVFPRLGVSRLSLGLGALLLLAVAATIYLQGLPAMFYAYFLCPVVLWGLVASRLPVFTQGWHQVRLHRQAWPLVFTTLLCTAGLWLLVAAFSSRWTLSIGLLAIAAWPHLPGLKAGVGGAVKVGWSVASLALAVFPLLPVVGRPANYSLVLATGGITVLLALGALYWNSPRRNSVQLGAQLVLLVLAMVIVSSTSRKVAQDLAVPLLHQGLSWLILASALVLPFFGSLGTLSRLLTISASFMAPLLLLSINYEALFFLVLSAHLFCWLCIEIYPQDPKDQSLADVIKNLSLIPEQDMVKKYPNLKDLQNAFFFLYFVILIFFGTGNIASISSFELSSVFNFTTVFRPFLIMGLVMLKTILPLLLLTCFARAVIVADRSSFSFLSMLVILMADFMAFYFFFMVQSSGTTLEIGTSLNHYIIIMATTVFIIILNGLAILYTSVAWPLPMPNFSKFHHQ